MFTDAVKALESRYVATIIITYDPLVDCYVRGVVLVPCGADYSATLGKVYDCLVNSKTDREAADAIRALGCPVLCFAGLETMKPCITRPALSQFGELPVKVGQPISKEADVEYQKVLDQGPVSAEFTLGKPEECNLGKAQPNGDFIPDQIFLCQHCGKEYRYGSSTAHLSLCFCSDICQSVYKRVTGREYPHIGAEIPLGKPEVCNLGKSNLGNEIVAEAIAGVKKLLGQGRSAPCNGRMIRGVLVTQDGATSEGFTVDDGNNGVFKDHASAVLYCLGHPGKGFPDLSMLKYTRGPEAAQEYAAQGYLDKEYLAVNRAVKSLEDIWKTMSAFMPVKEKLQPEAEQPALPVDEPATVVDMGVENRAAIALWKGAKLVGAVTLPSGLCIPQPSEGCCWLIQDDGTLLECAHSIVATSTKK